MTFVALFLLLLAIIMLYASWKNVSPFIVMRAFIEHKTVESYAEQPDK